MLIILIGAILIMLIISIVVCYSALCIAAEEDRRMEELYRKCEENAQNR